MFDKECQPGVASDAAKSLLKAQLETFHRETTAILSSQSPALVYKQQSKSKFDQYCNILRTCQALQPENNEAALRALADVAEEWNQFSKQRGDSELSREDDEYLDQLILDILGNLMDTAAHLIDLIHSPVIKDAANTLISTARPTNIPASDDSNCSTNNNNPVSNTGPADNPCDTEANCAGQPESRTNLIKTPSHQLHLVTEAVTQEPSLPIIETEQTFCQNPPPTDPVNRVPSLCEPETEQSYRQQRPAVEAGIEELPSPATETERQTSDSESAQISQPNNLAEGRKRKWVEPEDSPTPLRTVLTIDFADVYQGGKAANKYIILDYKHSLISHPEVSGRWWIARCEICDFHAAHASSRTAQQARLHMKCHPDLKTDGNASTLNAMGVLVLNCDEKLAKINNDSVWIAIENGYEPKTRTLGAKRRKTKIVRITVPLRNSMEPPVIVDPFVGKLYLALWSDGYLYAAIVVPLGDFDSVGIEGSLQESHLLDHLPNCFQYDKTRGKFCWKKDFQDGGTNVTHRLFPVLCFDQTTFKDCCFSWAQAIDLQRFDINKVLDKYKPVVNKFINEYQSGNNIDYKPFSFELSAPEKFKMTLRSSNTNHRQPIELENLVIHQPTAGELTLPVPQHATSVTGPISRGVEELADDVAPGDDLNSVGLQPQLDITGSQSYNLQHAQAEMVDSSSTPDEPATSQRLDSKGRQINTLGSVSTNPGSTEFCGARTLHLSVGNTLIDSTTPRLTTSQSEHAPFGPSGRCWSDEDDLNGTQSAESQRFEVSRHCRHSRSNSKTAGSYSSPRLARVYGQLGSEDSNTSITTLTETDRPRTGQLHVQIDSDGSAHGELVPELFEPVSDREFQMSRELSAERSVQSMEGPPATVREPGAQIAQMTPGSTSESLIPEIATIQQDKFFPAEKNRAVERCQQERDSSSLAPRVANVQDSQQTHCVISNNFDALSSVDISIIDGLAPELQELVRRG